MRDNAVERLFSLFTSSDRAVAIAGDMTQERERRGRIWFWLHVVRITFALWRNATTEAPLRVLALTLAGWGLFAAPALGGVAAVGLFPQLMGSAMSWIALSCFWWGGALWTGASLVAIAPRRGMAACAILAVVGVALLIAVCVTIESRELFGSVVRIFSTIALGTPVALFTGGAIARSRTIVAVTMLLFLTVASSASAQQSEWKDPSPHAVKLVTVDTDVQLEVLDWGGSGPALLLLAGLGDTAHVFDDFAPVLAARYRVVGVTRRGFGGSSAPATGYAFVRLAEDVMRVIATLGVKPVVVGHSFAGEEMHVLGARYAAAIAGLVYLDGAFYRADDFDQDDTVERTLPAPPRPEPADLASFAALRAFLERTQGTVAPEAHVRTRYVANRDGSVAGPWMPDLPIRQAYMTEMQGTRKAYDPERIRVPALAIYAVPKSSSDVMRPWYNADDPSIRERVQTLHSLAREQFARHRKWFETFAERGRVAEIAGKHHLFLTNAHEVLQQIDGFMASVAAAP